MALTRRVLGICQLRPILICSIGHEGSTSSIASLACMERTIAGLDMSEDEDSTNVHIVSTKANSENLDAIVNSYCAVFMPVMRRHVDEVPS